MLTEFTDIRSCLADYLQQRLDGLTRLGASTASNTDGNFYCALATELHAAEIDEGTLAKALATLVGVPDPHKVALRSAYRYVMLEPNDLSKLTYVRLQNLRESVLREIARGVGSSFSSIRHACVSGGHDRGFNPTQAQIRDVMQYYLDLGVIRVVRTAGQKYYGIA